jgi:hypothetical protein
MDRNDGGPAFPVTNNAMNADRGMTLRDYFAAKAMQALVSGDLADLADKDGVEGEPVVAYLARTAYHIADAMLAARAKERP